MNKHVAIFHFVLSDMTNNICRRGLRRKQGRDQPADDQLGVRVGKGRDPSERRRTGGNKHAFHGVGSQVLLYSIAGFFVFPCPNSQ